MYLFDDYYKLLIKCFYVKKKITSCYLWYQINTD